MPRALHFLLCLTLLAACDRPDESVRARRLASRALEGMLAFPQSSLVTVSAGEDAAEMTLSSPAPVAEIVAWYRQSLALNSWELKSEQERNGVVTMYAERRRQPVWITLRPAAAGGGTTYTLVGAILPADSTRKDTTRRTR